MSCIDREKLIHHRNRSEDEIRRLQEERMGVFSPAKLLPLVKMDTYKIDLRLLDDFEEQGNEKDSPLYQTYRYLQEDSENSAALMPILLVGPSGCGKTWTVMQAATKYHCFN
jgi:hypothetical protein